MSCLFDSESRRFTNGVRYGRILRNNYRVTLEVSDVRKSLWCGKGLFLLHGSLQLNWTLTFALGPSEGPPPS